MKRKHLMRTRGIPCLMAAVMLWSMLPLSAWAVETTTNAATAGKVVDTTDNKTAAQTASDAAAQTEAAAAAATIAVDVHIRTAKDLVELATKCQEEDYSVGLTVSLDRDINLDGTSLMPIPSFSGTFLGNGHTIKGFTCATNGSHQGLFRYVRSGGSVINLKVEGTVTPSGTRCAVGGIVGTNYGFVGNCQFTGTVSGLLNTGGIAGENYGIVKDCVAAGTVSAKHFVGGVVGYNEGSVGYCKNESGVNNEVFSESLSLDALDLDDILGVEDVASTEIDTVSDVGGVVGINTGIIKACENTGTVGYQHYGYNVGGVAGRQSGYMVDCANSGAVLGRKDVGGIVGQMTPYLILESSSSVSDELNAVQGATDSALSNLDNNSAVLGASLSDTAVYGVAISDRYYQTSEVIEKSNNGTLTVDDVTKGTSLEEEDDDDNTSVSDWVVDKSGKVADKTQEYSEVVGEDTINNAVNGNVTDTDKQNIANAAGQGASEASTAISQKKAEREQEEAAEEAKEAADNQEMTNNINNAIQSSKAAGNSLTTTIDQLTDDLAGVSEHYNKILSMIANALSGNYELTILNDISDQDTNDMKDGKVEGCTNSGTVSGDTNVGGIVGTMDTELDFDIEKILSATTSDTVELSTATYYCRDILTDCINDGTVEGKKENVGGVVGINTIGNVLLSQNYGDVTGSGDYYGGVVGKSTSNIRKCFAMCSLEGSTYIGGVVGQGKVIENCSTIITADESAACSGSVAGWVDFDNTESYVANNYFVNDEMGGIDGISYEGVCERVTYEQLLTMNALPDEFRTLKLTFVADGEVVDTIEFTYGDSLQESQIPAVPKKDGVSGVWEPFDYENMTRSETIEAQYNSRQTVVASDELKEGTSLSLVLAQGAFAENTSLHLEKYSGSEKLPLGGQSATTLTVRGTNPSISSYTVRWNTDGASAKIYRLGDDGRWYRVSSKMDGHYCVFTCSEKVNVLCVMDNPMYFLIRNAALAVIALIAAIVLLRYLERRYYFVSRCKAAWQRLHPPKTGSKKAKRLAKTS